MRTMHEETIAAAEEICRRAGLGDAQLSLLDASRVEPGYRHAILRCGLETTAEPAPETVIIKKSNLCGRHIQREWAALEFLGRIDEASDLVPGLIGGDEEFELLVLEDCGDVEDQKLKTLLYGDDPDSAADALIRIAEAFGRMQAAAANRLDEYQDIALGLAPPRPIDFHQRGKLLESLRELPALLQSCDILGATSLSTELDAVIEHLAEPGPWTTLVHGDYAPSNLIVTPDRIRIFDFEVAQPGHALLDGAYARLRHLNALDAMRLPLAIQQDMESVYRRALATTFPHVTDEDAFGLGMTSASLAWTAVTLSNLPRIMEEDKPRGPASFRQRIIASLDATGRTCVQFDRFPALREAIENLRAKLTARWPHESTRLDVFPALRDRT